MGGCERELAGEAIGHDALDLRNGVTRGFRTALDDLGRSVELDPRVSREIWPHDDICEAREMFAQLVFGHLERVHHDIEQIEAVKPTVEIRKRVQRSGRVTLA